MAKAPSSATLFTFNVGFGDCFLLRFNYSDRPRHVLIDFGTMSQPKGGPKNLHKVIADKIRELSGGHLEILVATHRHRDHVSGFSNKGGATSSGAIIASLKPDLVLQPWTEDPMIPVDATGPNGDAKLAGPQAPTAHSVRKSLNDMSTFASIVHGYATTRLGAGRRAASGAAKAMAAIGLDNIKNPEAVQNLIDMGKKAKNGVRYLKADDVVSVASLLPGVKLNVLGPPSVDQFPTVQKEAQSYRNQYWLKRSNTSAHIGADAFGKTLFPRRTGRIPPYGLWAARRARSAEAESLYGIVRDLDDAMNNTSLILLFQAGGKKLLFPGDAQGENWDYALTQKKAKYAPMLQDVDLYKVGHHGSRNATPKDLWDTFKNKGAKTKPGRMQSVMSTKHGVYPGSGKDPSLTAVPRSTLVQHLEAETTLQVTEDSKELFITTEIAFS